METGTKMHMKEWLIAQIESGKYRGLSWENEEKTMFRIPWKHAAKKDYRQTADAALFKVRALLLSPGSSPVTPKSFLHPNSVSHGPPVQHWIYLLQEPKTVSSIGL